MLCERVAVTGCQTLSGVSRSEHVAQFDSTWQQLGGSAREPQRRNPMADRLVEIARTRT